MASSIVAAGSQSDGDLGKLEPIPVELVPMALPPGTRLPHTMVCWQPSDQDLICLDRLAHPRVPFTVPASSCTALPLDSYSFPAARVWPTPFAFAHYGSGPSMPSKSFLRLAHFGEDGRSWLWTGMVETGLTFELNGGDDMMHNWKGTKALSAELSTYARGHPHDRLSFRIPPGRRRDDDADDEDYPLLRGSARRDSTGDRMPRMTDYQESLRQGVVLDGSPTKEEGWADGLRWADDDGLFAGEMHIPAALNSHEGTWYGRSVRLWVESDDQGDTFSLARSVLKDESTREAYDRVANRDGQILFGRLTFRLPESLSSLLPDPEALT